MGPSQTAANLANYCEGFANVMDMYEKRKRMLLTTMGLGGYLKTASGRRVALVIYMNSAPGKDICDAAITDLKRRR